MNRLPVIGITCYPTQGGSGVVASELGLSLARRDYEVHFITSSLPLRLKHYEQNIFFHQVEAVSYPVFQHTPYTLALATKMSEVTEEYGVDILHVHYAIPHAASAFLAQEMVGRDAVKVVTTLHGTDITLVGQEPGYFAMTRFLIERSDAVTTVSTFLRDETVRVFGVSRHIEVIPNFVESRRFRPRHDLDRTCLAAADEKIVVHASNFRPVKNISAVVRGFTRICEHVNARLILVGEGPDRRLAADIAAAEGVSDRIRFLGQVDNLEEILAMADLTLLPSLHESFGLVALESMACGTPAIVTANGGAGEFVEHGVNSFLCDPADIETIVAPAVKLLTDQDLYSQVADNGLRDAVARFGTPCVLKRYTELYDRVLA